MSETEAITVAESSGGFGSASEPGTTVSLPVVELLTGRGFVTGKSGSGKSNSASVIAEKLLDNGFGLLIVDIDGEYYGLKEEYEILHAGADEECDIQITADHAEKLASLALEQNVPIILDVSSYLDEDEAEEVLTAVSRRLFAKAKKQKQPFLLLVEEVHEYIPENGSVGECGKMLIKIGKRGRKHGLGICGISQRPADVKKDFITQCDWLLWHRLTWNNDTKVVGRILDNEYASAVEDLDDGEGFLMTDWAESVQRVQFYRKQTFDAGATPGLDDFERPDLKSVSEDLVSELQEISDEEQKRESRIAELREELDKKNSRIGELERELQDARDLSRMAEQFVEALVDEVHGPQPGRPERERMRQSHIDRGPSGWVEDTTEDSERTENEDERDGWDIEGPVEVDTANESQADDATEQSVEAENALDSADEKTASAEGNTENESTDSDTFGEAFGEGGMFGEIGESGGNQNPVGQPDPSTNGAVVGGGDVASTDGGSATKSNGAPTSEFSAEAIMNALNSVSEMSAGSEAEDSGTTTREEIEQSIRNDAEVLNEESKGDISDADSSETTTSVSEAPLGEQKELVVRELKAEISGLETKTRKMLDFYREMGPETPLNAHFSAGGDGSRTDAYSHNRRLRTSELIEHVGRGYYKYRLPELLADRFESENLIVDDEKLEEFVAEIEESALVD